MISLGLLYAEFKDAIHKGDGLPVVRCYRYFMLLFRAHGHRNYAIKTFTMLAECHCLHSPRTGEQLDLQFYNPMPNTLEMYSR